MLPSSKYALQSADLSRPVVGDRLPYGRGTKCGFLGLCCVDATLMMGVMGWVGGDGNVP